jgi:hypothetical protein
MKCTEKVVPVVILAISLLLEFSGGIVRVAGLFLMMRSFSIWSIL